MTCVVVRRKIMFIILSYYETYHLLTYTNSKSLDLNCMLLDVYLMWKQYLLKYFGDSLSSCSECPGKT